MVITMIVSGNWESALEGGWRWVSNIEDMEEGCLEVAHLGAVYGCDHVMIGSAFRQGRPLKIEDLGGFAIYLQDLEDLVKEIAEDLANFSNGMILRVKP